MIILVSSMLYGWLLGVEWSNDGKCAVMLFSIVETLFEFVGIVYVISLLIDKKLGGSEMIALLGFVFAVVVAVGVVALICWNEWKDGGGR